MDNLVERLALEMKGCVAEINTALDRILNASDETYVKTINASNLIIEKKAIEIYNKTLEFQKDNNDVDILESLKTKDSGNIEINIKDGELLIFMGRLPKKNQYAKLVKNELTNAFLKAIGSGVEIPSFTRKVIEVIHTYPVDCVAGVIRDNDNYNYKSIINTICHFTSSSDKGDNCWLIFKTKIAVDFSLGTEIKVYSQ